MRVLITGASGFLGSHLARAYLQRGNEVIAVVRRRGAGLPPASVTSIEGSLGEIALEDRTRAARAEVVHHLAYDLVALAAGEEEDRRVNVEGSARLIEAAIDGGASHVVLASSGFVYGDTEVLPIPETNALRPNSANGVSKLAVEEAVANVCAAHSVSLTILRYANLYDSLVPSSQDEARTGSRDRSVIARFAHALRNGEPARMAGDGGQTRDFIFVGDVVRANLAAADQRIAGAFNVGTGVETSIAEVWQIVQDALGMRGTVERGPAGRDDRARNALDGRKLRDVARLPDPLAVREGVGWSGGPLESNAERRTQNAER